MSDEIYSYVEGDIFTAAPLDHETKLKAWEPWELTRTLLFQFQNSDIDEEHPEWCFHWYAGVALLRTVGHVLHKVDGCRSEKSRKTIEKFWREWSDNKGQNWILWEFIEKERNAILKTFSFGAELPNDEDQRLLKYKDTDWDATQLFREAVYWWRHQLRGIERELNMPP